MSRPEVITKASVLAAHIDSLIADIQIANDYETDIGLRHFRGRLKIDDGQVPCAVLIEGEDRPGDQSGRDALKITQDYVIGGYVRCDPDHPNDAAHAVIRDIKRALFKNAPNGMLGQQNFDGRVHRVRYVGRDIGPRADGMPIVYAIVHIEVDYAETLANP